MSNKTEPNAPAFPRERLFAIRKDGVTFLQCLEASFLERALVKEFDRLYGCNLSMTGAPIELMIDKATGRFKHDMGKFCHFVWQCVFTSMPLSEDGVKAFAIFQALNAHGGEEK